MPDRTVDTALYDLHCKNEFQEARDERAELKQEFKELKSILVGNGKVGFTGRIDRIEQKWSWFVWLMAPVYIGIVGVGVKVIVEAINHVQGTP